jgi:hypothetical protein
MQYIDHIHKNCIERFNIAPNQTCTKLCSGKQNIDICELEWRGGTTKLFVITSMNFIVNYREE